MGVPLPSYDGGPQQISALFLTDLTLSLSDYDDERLSTVGRGAAAPALQLVQYTPM